MGRRIAELRAGRGWSQAVFAERAGVSVRYIQSVEGGQENLTLASICAFADLLKAPVEALMDFSGAQPAKRGRPPRAGRQAQPGRTPVKRK